MADICPCSPIGGRRSRQSCRSCNKQNCRGCPGRPIIRQFAQGIFMSGAGAPPHTACEPAPPCFPKPKNFLYQSWYDFAENRFYSLRKSATGAIIGYDVYDCGEQILNLFRLTTPGNIAAQGTVIASGPVLNMVECLVPRANEAIAYSSINPHALDYSNANANGAIVAARVAKCIANANMGIMGFIYGNPPTPAVISGIRPNQGFTTTPTIVVTPREFGFQVFVRDSRTGLYSRDPNNSPLTDPGFPANACNGDIFDDVKFNLRYQFNADVCKWFLISFVCPLAIGCDAINQGLMAGGFCEISPNWRDGCSCACGEKTCCGECEKVEEIEIVERIVEIKPCCKKEKKEKKKDCGCNKASEASEGSEDGDESSEPIVARGRRGGNSGSSVSSVASSRRASSVTSSVTSFADTSSLAIDAGAGGASNDDDASFSD